MNSRYIPPTYPVHSRTMTPREIPDTAHTTLADAVAAWQSRDFLAVLYHEGTHHRLTINRTQYDRHSETWRDGITWDDLQIVKSQCGFRDTWAVEVYPPMDQLVHVSGMRHLWLLDDAPAYAWRRTAEENR